MHSLIVSNTCYHQHDGYLIWFQSLEERGRNVKRNRNRARLLQMAATGAPWSPYFQFPLLRSGEWEFACVDNIDLGRNYSHNLYHLKYTIFLFASLGILCAIDADRSANWARLRFCFGLVGCIGFCYGMAMKHLSETAGCKSRACVSLPPCLPPNCDNLVHGVGCH